MIRFVVCTSVTLPVATIRSLSSEDLHLIRVERRVAELHLDVVAEQVAILADLLLVAGDDVVDTRQRLLSLGGVH